MMLRRYHFRRTEVTDDPAVLEAAQAEIARLLAQQEATLQEPEKPAEVEEVQTSSKKRSKASE